MKIRWNFAISMVLAASTLCSVSSSAFAGYLDKSRAVQYARANWNSRPGGFPSYGNDCTNFVSQCLLAGGWNQAGGWYNYRTDYAWFHDGSYASYAWGDANRLANFILKSGRRTYSETDWWDLEPGDIVMCDWGDGNGNPDGTLDYVAIVIRTGYGPVGLYLSQHSNDRLDQSISAYWNAAPRGRFYYFRLKRSF